MTTSLPLPYVRNPAELPAPLPTTSEILASTDILKGSETWATAKSNRCRPPFHRQIQRSNDPIEGSNLFLEQDNLLGFAPRLYAMWKDEGDRTLYLVMERLRGATLESLWPALQESDKDRILAKTRALLTRIRAVPHRGFFGSVEQTQLPYHLFYWPQYPAHISGPFTTERALVQGMIAKSRANAEYNKRHPHLAGFFEEQFMTRLANDGRTPIFTHSDLQRKNILVEEVEGDQGEKDFRVLLVDWESAGWYPAYWEYFVAFISLKWDDDWSNRVVDIVDPWLAEAAMMKMIYHDLWM